MINIKIHNNVISKKVTDDNGNTETLYLDTLTEEWVRRLPNDKILRIGKANVDELIFIFTH